MTAVTKFTKSFDEQGVRRTDPKIWRKEHSVPNTHGPINYFLLADALNKKNA
jgi:hypothetical protein